MIKFKEVIIKMNKTSQDPTPEELLQTMKEIWTKHFTVDLFHPNTYSQLIKQSLNHIRRVNQAPDLDGLAELLTDLEVDPFEVRLSLLRAWWSPDPIPETLKIAFTQVA